MQLAVQTPHGDTRYVFDIFDGATTLYRVDGGRVTRIDDAQWLPNYVAGSLICHAPSQEVSTFMVFPARGEAYVLSPQKASVPVSSLDADAKAQLENLARSRQ